MVVLTHLPHFEKFAGLLCVSQLITFSRKKKILCVFGIFSGTSDLSSLCCIFLVFLLLDILHLLFLFTCPGPIQLLTDQTKKKSYIISSDEY